MSTVRADNVAPSAGGTPRNLPRGVAAAWFNLNGTGTIAGRDSVNISSYTDNGTGDYTSTFTAAASSANYGMGSVANIVLSTSDVTRDDNLNWAPVDCAAGYVRGVTAYTDAIRDAAIASAVIFGSLA